MVLSTVRPPAALPVSVVDAKAHLRLTHDGEDALVADLIAAAGAFVAEDAGIALINQVLRLSLSDRPAEPVALPRHPIARIETVTVYDGDGSPTVLEGAQYRFDMMRKPARLSFEPGAVPRQTNGIEIDFVAGFGDAAADIPHTLRRAVLALVSHWYELRGAYGPSDQPVSVPVHYARLIRPWRRVGL